MCFRASYSIILVMFCVQIAAAAAEPPVVNLPSVTPAVVSGNAPTDVRVTTRILGRGALVLEESVTALSVDASGRMTAIARLNDRGVDGDRATGDGLFTGQFTVARQPGGTEDSGICSVQRILKRVQSADSLLHFLDNGSPVGLAPSTLAGAIWRDGRNDPVLCDEILAYAVPGTPIATIRAASQRVGAEVVGIIPAGTPKSLNTFQLRLPCTGAATLESAIAVVASSPGIVEAGPNSLARKHQSALASADPYLHDQLRFGYERIELDRAWGLGLPTASSALIQRRIAILDTGIDYCVKDIGGMPDCSQTNPPQTHVLRGWDFAENDNDPSTDGDDHGTMVASIAGARALNGLGIIGASPTSDLVAIRVIREHWNWAWSLCSWSAAGIRHASDDWNADIINMSYGRFNSCVAERDAARDVKLQGKLLFASAGNENCDGEQYPAAYLGVIAVGASELSELRPHENRWDDTPGTKCESDSGSNYGPWVHLYAPGYQLPVVRYDESVHNRSGTSFASPLVAGIAAFAWTLAPQWTASELTENILELADSVAMTDPFDNPLVDSSGTPSVKRVNARKLVCRALGRCDTRIGAPIPLRPTSKVDQNAAPSCSGS